MSNNVVPFRSYPRVQPSPLPLAAVQAGASPIAHGGINDTYHGEILLASGEVRLAYIKDLDPRELANELMIACLAKIQGWSVPDTYLAQADTSVLPLRKAPTQTDGSRLVLASADARTPSLRHFFEARDLATTTALVHKLAHAEAVSDLYAIDTWCANTDRNLGNVLVGANDIWLIDHGRCFVTPELSPSELRPEVAYQNLAALWLTPQVAPARRASVVDATVAATLIEDTALDQLGTLSHAREIIPAAEVEALIAFLKERRLHVRELATQALALLVA